MRLRILDPSPEELLLFLLSLLIILSLLLASGIISILQVIYLICTAIIVYALILIIARYFLIFTKDYERAVIFRFGKFNRIVGPGWALKIPIIEEVYQIVDVRVQKLLLENLEAFTKNDVLLKLNLIAFFRIEDVYKAVLKVRDYLSSLKTRIFGEIRNSIGRMLIWEVFMNIDKLNEILSEDLNKIALEWGIKVERVEILSVEPPVELIEAFYRPVAKKYELMATKYLAEAKKIVIEAIGRAAKELDDKGIAILYFKALEKIAEGKATKIIFPLAFVKFLDELKESLKAKGFESSELINQIASFIKSNKGA